MPALGRWPSVACAHAENLDMRQAHTPQPRARQGMTLIELMVAVAIVAILASTVMPSLMQQIRQGRRADALDATAAVQQAQERWRANNTSYASTLTSLNTSATSKDGYYGIALSASSATGYTVTATAVAGKSQASDSGCTALVVAVVNGAATKTPTQCWRQ